MAITNTRLTTTGSTTVFSAANGQAITVIYLTNTTATPVSANVYAIDGGVGASASNMIYSQISLTAKDTYVISTEKLILENTDTITVAANIADCVTVTVSSINI